MIAKHYLEAHVTIEPIFDEHLEHATKIAQMHGFKIATLLMKKRAEDTEQRSQFDTFMTAHSVSSLVLEGQITALVHALTVNGFKVWRYKIEDIIIDSRIHDELGLLGL